MRQLNSALLTIALAIAPAFSVRGAAAEPRPSAQEPRVAGERWGAITIGPVSVAPGRLASGYIEVPAAADSATRVPITVIRGRTR